MSIGLQCIEQYFSCEYIYWHKIRNETIQATIDGRGSLSITPAYSERAYYNLFDIINTINGRKKNSLFQIGNDITKYTFLIKPGTTLPLTGLQAQLDFHNGEIKHYGDAVLLKNRLTTYDTPYIGERNNNDIVNDAITDDDSELGFREDILRVRPSDFTAIPQREVSKAANHEQRTSGPIIDTVKYKTLAYSQIRTITRDRAVGSTTIIDATTGETFDTKKTPIANVATDKKVTGIVNTAKDKSVSERWARIEENNNPIPDLIKFKIGGVAFFAYLTSLSMSDSFGTDEKKELLAPYGQFLYSDHSRSVDVSFMVVADSAAQLERQWSKLRQLQQQSGPVNISSGMIRPKTSSLTIGDIYNSLPVILESISFSIDNESPWEITDTYQRPMYISVDVSCRVLPSSKTSLPTVG
jgi:hypothetical protein